MSVDVTSIYTLGDGGTEIDWIDWVEPGTTAEECMLYNRVIDDTFAKHGRQVISCTHLLEGLLKSAGPEDVADLKMQHNKVWDMIDERFEQHPSLAFVRVPDSRCMLWYHGTGIVSEEGQSPGKSDLSLFIARFGLFDSLAKMLDNSQLLSLYSASLHPLNETTSSSTILRRLFISTQGVAVASSASYLVTFDPSGHKTLAPTLLQPSERTVCNRHQRVLTGRRCNDQHFIVSSFNAGSQTAPPHWVPSDAKFFPGLISAHLDSIALRESPVALVTDRMFICWPPVTTARIQYAYKSRGHGYRECALLLEDPVGVTFGQVKAWLRAMKLREPYGSSTYKYVCVVFDGWDLDRCAAEKTPVHPMTGQPSNVTSPHSGMSSATSTVLVSADSKRVTCSLKAAMQSGTISHALNDTGGTHTQAEVPLEGVGKGELLQRIVMFLEYHRNDPFDIDIVAADYEGEWDQRYITIEMPGLLQLVKVADYLEIPRLIGLCCHSVAKRIGNQTPLELRDSFEFEDEGNEDMPDNIEREHKWLQKWRDGSRERKSRRMHGRLW